jgi:predicted dehydrogenase
MTISESKDLVALANQQGLQITSAPCSLLGETAQTLWKAVRENAIGKVRLVYAEIDDGMIHQSSYKTWLSASGIPWPYQDEFEIGCTLEHAGYYVTWLAAFFGPAESVTAFSSCLIPNKVSNELLNPSNTPDFSVACIKFKSGVVARLTCSIVAPHNHSLKIIGDDGLLETEECWFYDAPVYVQYREESSLTNPTDFNISKQSIVLVQKFFSYAKRIQNKILMKQKNKTIYPLVRKPPKSKWYEDGGMQMDLSRGVAEMAASITEQRPNRLSADFSLHTNELVLAIHQAFQIRETVYLTTTFEPIEPMDWAK